MNDEQIDGMRVVDAQTGALHYRVRGSRIVNAQTGQFAFRIRMNERVVDPMTGRLVFRIRDGVRLVDASNGYIGSVCAAERRRHSATAGGLPQLVAGTVP